MNKTLTSFGICIALSALFFTFSISGCKPEKTTTPSHCTNGIKDSDETGVDCGGSCDACGSGNSTLACFTVAKDTVIKDSTITFTNCSQNATSYKWTFGDGSSSTLQTPTHTYATYGPHEVILIATGTLGADTVSKWLTIASTGAAYVGNFAGQDACTSGNYTYTSSITGNGINGITIANFGGFNVPVNGIISGWGFTIPSQTSGIYTISGTGNISDNNQTINIVYTASDGSSTDNCTSVYTRQ